MSGEEVTTEMDEEMQEFREFLERHTNVDSERSQDMYIAWVRKLERPLDFEEMQYGEVKRWLDMAITNSSYGSAFKQYLSFKARSGGYDRDTVDIIYRLKQEVDDWNLKTSRGLTKTRVIEKYLTTQQVQEFHTYLKRHTRPKAFKNSYRKTQEYKLLPIFLFETACRIEEALGVNVNNIDWENNTIRIKGKGRDGGKVRKVNFNQSKKLLRELVNEFDITGELFALDRDSDYGALNDRFKRVGAKLFDKESTAHWFRHSFATNFAIMRIQENIEESGDDNPRKGEVKNQIREYLGHDSIDTTETYIHAAEELSRDNIYKEGGFDLEI